MKVLQDDYKDVIVRATYGDKAEQKPASGVRLILRWVLVLAQ